MFFIFAFSLLFSYLLLLRIFQMIIHILNISFGTLVINFDLIIFGRNLPSVFVNLHIFIQDIVIKGLVNIFNIIIIKKLGILKLEDLMKSQGGFGFVVCYFMDFEINMGIVNDLHLNWTIHGRALNNCGRFPFCNRKLIGT